MLKFALDFLEDDFIMNTKKNIIISYIMFQRIDVKLSLFVIECLVRLAATKV
jgi:uncharacterized protein YjgD (DUF1641 family)